MNTDGFGWDMYFKDINKTVTVFTNKIKDTNEEAENYNVIQRNLPYKSIDTLIQENNKDVNTAMLFPFGENKYESIEDMINKIEDICSNNKKNFIYAYVDDPDATMHKTGTNSTETKSIIKLLNDEIERLSKNVKDAVIIVTADHGHINSSKINLEDYKDLKQMLERDISIESRACAFFVKEGLKEKFEKLFNNYFGSDFILLTKQEVIDKRFFGIGKENEFFRDAIRRLPSTSDR